MNRGAFLVHGGSQAPDMQPREVLQRLRVSPGYADFLALMNDRLAQARETYETTPASEYNRARVTTLREVVTFLVTGDI